LKKRKRNICVVLVDRANYGRVKPVMRAINTHPDLALQVVAAGTMTLERFGLASELVKGDGFAVDSEVYSEVEGSKPATMAKSVGFSIIEFAGEFHRLRPDMVLLIGDRYETLAAAITAAYMNIPVTHIQGGEVSGSIDESARHAITKFAQYHVPSTARSAEYLIRMGERPETILTVGCPGSDLARSVEGPLPASVLNGTGSGAHIDLSKPFLLAIFHPITTEFGGGRAQMAVLLDALKRIGKQTILLWPNIDAGADHISKAIRSYRDRHHPDWLRTITNLEPEQYLRILAAASCAVGNSSSFVRDASYFGTPVVLIGRRQTGRETGANVTSCDVNASQILAAVRTQLAHGRYRPSDLYGDGLVSERIAAALATLRPYVQKRLGYADSDLTQQVLWGRAAGD